MTTLKARAQTSGVRDDRGQVLLLVAFSLVVLMGIAALTLDASFMYDRRNKLYSAADAAAKLAATEMKKSGGSNLQTFANHQVAMHGLTPGANGVTVTVNNPPSAGAFAGNAGFVEVIVTQNHSTFFGNVLGIASMTPGARAVAGYGNPSNCLITTQGPGITSPYSLEIGNTTLTMNGCGVGVGGELSGSNPNATITGTPAPTVSVTGTCWNTCGNFANLGQGAPPPIDPLAGTLAIPSNPGGCVAGTAATLTPGCYTSIATTVKTLSPGGNNIYYLTGDINVDHSDLTANGVMLYLTNSATIHGNQPNLTFTAPSSGPYAGIAVFQDPFNTSDWDIKNGGTLALTGVIYAPGTDLSFKNHLDITNTGCNLIIAHSLDIFNGNSAFGNGNCFSLFGTAAFLSVSIAE